MHPGFPVPGGKSYEARTIQTEQALQLSELSYWKEEASTVFSELSACL